MSHLSHATLADPIGAVDFDGNVRFAFRHFPLEEVHPHGRQAAEAAERYVLTIADALREGAVPHLGRDRSND